MKTMKVLYTTEEGGRFQITDVPTATDGDWVLDYLGAHAVILPNDEVHDVVNGLRPKQFCYPGRYLRTLKDISQRART